MRGPIHVKFYVSISAACFDLNCFILRLLNNFKKHIEEDNIQLIVSHS
jgi:hypothetical protein